MSSKAISFDLATTLPAREGIKKSFSFNPETDIPSIQGKVILITGANTGIGLHTALELAKHNPSQIWMTSRNIEKGELAVAQVKAQSPDVSVFLLELDLASLESVKIAAKRLIESAERLDMLFLNAGIFGHPAAVTADGYEIHMVSRRCAWQEIVSDKAKGTNHLGHAALLRLLAPLLVKSSSPAADVRVISLTSIGYKMGKAEDGISFDTLKQADGIWPGERYIQSKLANLLYAQKVAERYPYFKTIPIHPGEVDTALFTREAGDETIRYLQKEVVPKHAKPISEGVKNSLWAATATAVMSGHYYEPVGVSGLETSWAKDETLKNRLWEWTERELDAHGI